MRASARRSITQSTSRKSCARCGMAAAPWLPVRFHQRWAAVIPRAGPTATTRAKPAGCYGPPATRTALRCSCGGRGATLSWAKSRTPFRHSSPPSAIALRTCPATPPTLARPCPKATTRLPILDWWADYPDADNFLYPLFHSASFGPGGNYSFYSDRITDSLIMVARRTVDQAARETLYHRIETRVFDAAPWIYLWFPVDLWAEHPSIEGWDVPVIFNGQHWTKVRVAARR